MRNRPNINREESRKRFEERKAKVEALMRGAIFISKAGGSDLYPERESTSASKALCSVNSYISVRFSNGETHFLGCWNTYEQSTAPQSDLARNVKNAARRMARDIIDQA